MNHHLPSAILIDHLPFIIYHLSFTINHHLPSFIIQPSFITTLTSYFTMKFILQFPPGRRQAPCTVRIAVASLGPFGAWVTRRSWRPKAKCHGWMASRWPGAVVGVELPGEVRSQIQLKKYGLNAVSVTISMVLVVSLLVLLWVWFGWFYTIFTVMLMNFGGFILLLLL